VFVLSTDNFLRSVVLARVNNSREGEYLTLNRPVQNECVEQSGFLPDVLIA